MQKEPDCRTLVHCKQTILPACDKTKNRNENHPTERKRRESDTEHDRLRHLPTENQNGDQNPARIHFPPATAILLARQALQRGRPTAQSTPGSRIPQDERCLPDETYNGIVELTVGPLSGKSEIALVKRLAWEQPQTRLVFTGSSGRTVKIWTTFTRPNNSLPGKREEAEVFHAHAYRLAVKCYQPQLPFDILLKEPKLEQYSRLSFDPEAMYRPDSIQFYLAQPASMPDETTYREALQDEKSPLTRAVPGYEAEEAIIMLFEAALQKTFAEATGAGADNSLHSLTVRLAENCFRSGIPEEETVKRTYFHYYLRQKETVIRQIVRSVYQENKGFNTQSSLSKEQRLAIQTDEFMKRRYDFRYNTQVGEVEYRERHSFRFRFSPIDKRTLNSIALDAQSEGIPLWDRDISRYIYSNRIPVFNPLEDYLYDLPHWDGKDRILALARTVPCNNPYWAELFHRWFLNMVAHWRGNTDKKYANSVSPLLVGAQGTRKAPFAEASSRPSCVPIIRTASTSRASVTLSFTSTVLRSSTSMNSTR